MRITCVQTNPGYRQVKANLDEMRQLVSPDADLHVFPELALTGYLFTSSEELRDLAEPIDGPLANAISEVARKNRTAIVTGFLEECGGKFYNSALAFDQRGDLIGHYRKVHLFYLETQIFSPGDLGFPVFDLALSSGDVVRLGMLICYDWRFPEAARALALSGAEIIAMPSNIVTSTGMLDVTLRTRAFENKLYLAFADRVGEESHSFTPNDISLTFQGMSAIYGFNGDLLAEAGPTQAEKITVEIEPASTRGKRINAYNDLLGDRRPTSYDLG